MKQLASFSKLSALVLALATVVFVTPAQAVTNAGTQQGKATVVKVNGSATFKAASGQGGDLKVGQILEAGASISTGPAATVELNMGVNGQSLTVKSDSTVAIDQLDFTGTGADTVVNTRLNLTKGGLNGNVKKLAANSKYEIKTANGVAGVRGTSFSALASGVVHVWQGSVYMIYIVGGVASAPILVLEGQTVFPPTTPGGKPTLGDLPPGMERGTGYTVPDKESAPAPLTLIYVSPTAPPH